LSIDDIAHTFLKIFVPFKFVYFYVFYRRLYQFIGNVSKSAEPPMFQGLFQQYENQTGNFCFFQ